MYMPFYGIFAIEYAKWICQLQSSLFKHAFVQKYISQWLENMTLLQRWSLLDAASHYEWKPSLKLV